MIYFQYLKYLLRHKWFVFVECFRVGLIWRGVVHDLSKFTPLEFIAYAQWFCGAKGLKFRKTEPDDFAYWNDEEHARIKERFDFAWLHHQHNNLHHWQYWVLRRDSGETTPKEMPEHYAAEMICDWKGAGKAQGFTQKDECQNWFKKNQEKMLLHPKTRHLVEILLGIRDRYEGL